MRETWIQHGTHWMRFQQPKHVLEAYVLEDVLPVLQKVEHWAGYAVGFISYEAAPVFDSALRTRKPLPSFPLLYFALYSDCKIFQNIERCSEKNQIQFDWTLSVSKIEYENAIFEIRKQIEQGNTYQANYTWRLRSRWIAEPWCYFQTLFQAQRPGHAAYLDTGRYVILSVSPELFFSLDGQQLTTRPMKGTAARAPETIADLAEAKKLKSSPKERAENVMIVDMMRNDLSRISKTGSVQTPRLFEIEQYPTVWQMTSTVEAKTNRSVSEIFRALFPAASVTGAPKVKTMEILANLETSPRGIYTGSIGWMGPSRQAEFNVAIRTLVVDRMEGIAEYGVGGGIVWDSKAHAEYAECFVKTKVLSTHHPAFSILETLLWTRENGFFLLKEHIERMLSSARYFGYPTDEKKLKRVFSDARFEDGPRRVRILLNERGEIQMESSLLGEKIRNLVLEIAKSPIDSSDPFLFHKTTHRTVYESAGAKTGEVLLWNTRGEMTETTIANIVVDFGSGKITPPIASGLLPGTFRRSLLECGEIREQVVTLEEINQAKSIWLINSIRGWRKANLANPLV